MPLSSMSAALLVAAALCASIMGYAIQRGGTCTVAAVDEWLTQRRASRLVAMLEASLWVAGGLLLAMHFGALAALPRGAALTAWTVLGAALLGLGALINKACVFGTVARWGQGEWAYLATGLGFYWGGWIADRVMPMAAQMPSDEGLSPSALSMAPGLALLMLGLFGTWRLRGLLPGAGRASDGTQPARPGDTSGWWSPHSATAAIGITFVALWLLVGSAWAYTDVLVDWARGVHRDGLLRLTLLLCLLGGALWGGRHTAMRRSGLGSPVAWLRCLAGGLLMGLGSVLTPGGNDGLILLGMPLLWPHAWLAFAVMCLCIATGLGMQRRWAPGR